MNIGDLNKDTRSIGANGHGMNEIINKEDIHAGFFSLSLSLSLQITPVVSLACSKKTCVHSRLHRNLFRHYASSHWVYIATIDDLEMGLS